MIPRQVDQQKVEEEVVVEVVVLHLQSHKVQKVQGVDPVEVEGVVHLKVQEVEGHKALGEVVVHLKV